MYDINAISKRLKSLRKERYKLYLEHENETKKQYTKYSYCKSQSDLSEKLRVDRRTIGKWEKGKAIPSLENLIELSDLLDCSIDYFLGTGDLPEIDPIAKASHYSRISSQIIRYGLDNSDYLDCLNFFMLPDNCSTLFNNITLSAWKEYNVDQDLSEIKEPLNSTVLRAFEKFNAVTPISQISKNIYKQFLISELPKEKLVFSSKPNDKGLGIKACLVLSRFQELSLSKESEHRYDDFINYLVNYTYEPLMNKAVLELQKEKLAKAFVSLFSRYLSK